MRRKVFTLPAAVSAMLCVGLGLLWVQSYRVVDLVTHKSDSGGVVGLLAYRCSIGAVWFREPAARPGDRPFGHAGLSVRGRWRPCREFRYVRLPKTSPRLRRFDRQPQRGGGPAGGGG
jgi:hypothetical protein